MKTVQITLLATVVLFWTGCSSNEATVPVNTAKHVVTLENGKRYNVPVGSSYTKEAVTQKVIKRYVELGLKTCKNGDITWEEASVAERINAAMREGTKDEGLSIIKNAIQEGTIGCSSPIPNK